MIKKDYYIGRIGRISYLVGIHRSGEGTVSFLDDEANVKRDFSVLVFRSDDSVRGYFLAIQRDLATEDRFIDVKIRNWDKKANTLFRNYLEDQPGWVRDIKPLDKRNLEYLMSD